ncbi:MAG: caspase family protein [Rubrivivax sp.]|nr:caspase family protein [Rubrivivax sp.]
MTSPPSIFCTAALGLALLAAGPATAQVQLSETPPGPVGGVPATLPQIQLPQVRDLKVDVPRPVRAAQAALGLGRQRLALVVGLGTVGTRRVVDSAARDTAAVASALRSGGFVVMQRSDVSAAELRRALQEFRTRLQPAGVGFVYLTGLGAQLDGRNLLLARETLLDPALPAGALAAQLRDAAVPLDEVTDALIGPVDSPRLLVVDAAWKHPALARLPLPGLAEPRLPVGTMALFGQALGSAQEVPYVAPLPIPAPTDAVALAATPFARTLVAALLTPRISGPEALRSTRRAIAEATLGQASPWLGGDTEAREEFAEATLLDGLIPRTPEEIAREGARQASRLVTRPGAARAGELPVAEVLRQGHAAVPPDDGARKPADNANKLPEAPGTASSLGSVAGKVAGALGAAAGVAATVAGTTATAAAVEAAVVAAAATTAVGLASTAAGAATSTLGNAAALAARITAAGATPAGAAAVQAAASTVPTAPSLGTGTASVTPPASPAATVLPPGPAPAPAVTGGAPTAAAMTPAAADVGAAAAAAGGANLARRIAQTALTSAADGTAQNDNAPRSPSDTDGRTQRGPDGGERPRFTPRTNPNGYAEGDTFTWQVTDTWKGEVAGKYTTAIEQVLDDGRLVANGQQVQLDAQGRVTRHVNAEGGVSQFDPAQALWWAKPVAGERRIVKYVEKFRRADRAAGQTEWTGSARVGKLRKLQTPAGEFEVLPVESSGWWYTKLANGTLSSGQWSRTAYYAPRLGHPVAIEIENADRLGKLMKRERIDLLHAQTARTQP